MFLAIGRSTVDILDKEIVSQGLIYNIGDKTSSPRSSLNSMSLSMRRLFKGEKKLRFICDGSSKSGVHHILAVTVREKVSGADLMIQDSFSTNATPNRITTRVRIPCLVHIEQCVFKSKLLESSTFARSTEFGCHRNELYKISPNSYAGLAR